MEKLLRQHPLLMSLDRETQALLLPNFSPRTYSAGESVIDEGSFDRDLYLLLEGTLDVWVRREDKRYCVARLDPGAMVGEMAFFDVEVPRTASVVGGQGGGLLAGLELVTYFELLADGDPAAEALEKAVLAVLADRMTLTNRNLAALLGQHRAGGFLTALASLFRRK